MCVQVHAYIISHLKKEMPSMFGKDAKKKELISKLPDIFATLQREHQISPGDFPNVKRMQEQLGFHDFTKFKELKPKLLESVDTMLAQDIARLMQVRHLAGTSLGILTPILHNILGQCLTLKLPELNDFHSAKWKSFSSGS